MCGAWLSALPGVLQEEHTTLRRLFDHFVPLCVEAMTASAPWAADGIIGHGLLHILDPVRIDPAAILLIRKRLAPPATTALSIVTPMYQARPRGGGSTFIRVRKGS